jgi:hypothetical protein
VTRDPERLLSVVSEADPFERELLASLRGEQAPASVRRGAWQGIAAALVAAAPASAAAAGAVLGTGSAAAAGGGVAGGTALPGSAAATLSASAGAAASGGAVASGSIAPAAAVGSKLAAGLGAKVAALLVTKWLVVGALGAGAVGGAIWAVERKPVTQEAAPQLGAADQPAARRETSDVTSETHAVQPESNEAADQVEPAVTEQATPSAAGRSGKHPRIDALAAESALLQDARAELRSGNLEATARALDNLRHRFPRGVLSQEREILKIELASARGDDQGARRLASRFLRSHPESPHATQLRPLVSEP